MREDIQLISSIRHIRRQSNSVITSMLLLSSVLFYASLNSGHKSKITHTIVYAGGAIATLITGQLYLFKLGRKKRKMCQRLSQIQMERSS